MINDIKLFYLWGLPIVKAKILPDSFNKKNIVDTIINNYKSKPRRSSNLKNNFGTDIHQSLYDKDGIVEDPDYESLKEPYTHVIQNYLHHLKLQKDHDVEFSTLNYTASNETSYLAPHCHEDSDFAMTHYLQFDTTNSPTTFVNPYTFNDYWIRQNRISSSVSNNIENSWVFDTWTFDTEENDVIIFPAILKHFANIKKSDHIRITLATNIKLL